MTDSCYEVLRVTTEEMKFALSIGCIAVGQTEGRRDQCESARFVREHSGYRGIFAIREAFGNDAQKFQAIVQRIYALLELSKDPHMPGVRRKVREADAVEFTEPVIRAAATMSLDARHGFDRAAFYDEVNPNAAAPPPRMDDLLAMTQVAPA